MKKLVNSLYQTAKNQTREKVFFKNKDHRHQVINLAHEHGVKVIAKSKTTLIYQLPPKQ
ncbi:MAG: hypothetical protein KBC12_00110 [Candidatus Pacebacteria bacterium]|nr:hypothetical protein [Candidatus Paceibacterota bacterium]